MGDAEKTFLLSQPYIDNLWKIIDDVEAQEQKAQEIMQQMNSNNEVNNDNNKNEAVIE